MVQIETYEIEELMTATGTTPEAEAEAIALIERLGLKGQQSLVVKPEAKTETRIQYPQMNAQERAVYRTVFPATSNVNDYAAGIIPVRVLQVVAHARDVFESIQVWHKEVRDPDPLLVGHVKTHDQKPYMLARWGDALKPFKELIDEARESLKREYRDRIAEYVTQCQSALVKVDSIVEKRLAGQEIHFYCNVS